MSGSSQTSEREMIQKEHGGRSAAAGAASEEVLYKIDIPANRYDMLCLEGVARALNIFARRIPRVEYRLADMTGRRPPGSTPLIALAMRWGACMAAG